MKYIKYGNWNLFKSSEIDDIAYKMYLTEFDNKYLKGSPYLDQSTFYMYYKNNNNIYYKYAKQKIRINKINKIEKNKLSNNYNI